MIEVHAKDEALLNLTVINVGPGLQFHQLDRNLNGMISNVKGQARTLSL